MAADENPTTETRAPWITWLAAFLLAGCGSTRPERESEARGRYDESAFAPRAIELQEGPAFDTIAELEDARAGDDVRFVGFLTHTEPAVRARAALALGRMPFPEVGAQVTAALSKMLEDPEGEVRCSAAFALGIRGDPRAAGVLLAWRNDPDPGVRARVVEAAGRLGDAHIAPDVLLALRDVDLDVRIAAAHAAARFDPAGADASDVDRALLDALSPHGLHVSDPAELEPEFVTALLYALMRRGAELGRGAYLEYSASPLALQRLFAVRGLARLPASPEIATALASVFEREGTLASPDWRVAYEAVVGLGHQADPDTLATLESALEHESAHVRSAALGALGMLSVIKEAVLPSLRRGARDLSASVRATALGALVRLVSSDDAASAIGDAAGDEDPVVRAGAATAAGEVDDERAALLLERLTKDPHPRVATSAVDALARHPSVETRELLHGLLAGDDNGVRLSAVLALRGMADPSDVAPLIGAFHGSSGDISAEIAFNVLENLGRIGGEDARALCEDALDDPRPFVRRVAERILSERFASTDAAARAPSEPEILAVPRPGAGLPRSSENPLVSVETTRGRMVFELFPAEAPLHVANFLALGSSGHYDGLTFHRVVPDFVIQGGDYRGDGNGAKPWRGEALRAEFTPRPFVRGSLGMPRNEDPDSGGSQFFVTHCPTPHLDGRYTIFGELRAGGEVLDAIEVGDRILSVRAFETARASSR